MADPKRRILIVDDTKNIRDIVGFMLRNRGYEVVLAEDGDQGYQLATTIEPHLIVLDVMMPGRSGFEICSDLKANVKFRHIPIILLTAVAQGSGITDEQWKARSGADEFVSKPFQTRELIQRIEKLLGVAA
jgi:two-component system response regulator VicR